MNWRERERERERGREGEREREGGGGRRDDSYMIKEESRNREAPSGKSLL